MTADGPGARRDAVDGQAPAEAGWTTSAMGRGATLLPPPEAAPGGPADPSPLAQAVSLSVQAAVLATGTALAAAGAGCAALRQLAELAATGRAMVRGAASPLPGTDAPDRR